MVILQCSEQPRLAARLEELGVRVVWRFEGARARAVHLHPKDVPGAIVSLDWMAEPDGWLWAGEDWKRHVHLDRTTAVTAAVIGADDPVALAARWASVLDLPLDEGATTLTLDDAEIRFLAAGPRGEGLDGLEVRSAGAVLAGQVVELAGVRISFV